MSNADQPDEPSSGPAAGFPRREFVTTVAGAGAAFMIVPRHVLGRGFQAPSDTLNIAAIASTARARSTRAPW